MPRLIMHFKKNLHLISFAAGLGIALQAYASTPTDSGIYEVGIVSNLAQLPPSTALESETKQPLAPALDQLTTVSPPQSVEPSGSLILNDRGEALAEPRLDKPLEALSPSEPEGSVKSAHGTVKVDYKDLWERMRSGFALQPLDSPLVNKHIQFYAQKPEYLERMFERGSRYLFYIVEEIERRGMPGELALLPFVESAMNPTALSPAKAAGLWQFIPSTGKAFNLSQNWWVDNRRDPVHSTQAALDYLQRIYELQGNDWFLALASYNWGEGAVGRAMRRNQSSGKPFDYLSLNMPNETRHYVPKLMALREIVANPQAYNLRLPLLPNKPYFVEVEAPLHLDLKLAARFAGMSEEEFLSLNPAHNRPVIAASSNDQIKIPADRVDAFLAAMKAHEASNKPFSRWRPYTLEPGESLQSLAGRLGTSSQEIMRANGLRSAKVLPGTRLLAPAPDDKPSTIAVMSSFDGPRILEKVQRPAQYHRVGKKETTESIAKRYGASVTSLQTWNNLKHEVKQGMRILVRPASAQTVLTNESGVARVIATELVTPKQNAEAKKDASKDKAPAKPNASAKSAEVSKATTSAKIKPEPAQNTQIAKASSKQQATPSATKPQPRAETSRANRAAGPEIQAAKPKA
ncbi:MAG: LysM peptidoglycan-binding domain-containing protein, partial [Betaproteobacteria bacterium]|nr:LysM peptidoglycan-binding domain-containing protein [Betaproteobacteria bacterium]